MASEPNSTNVTDLPSGKSAARDAARAVGDAVDEAASTAEAELDALADAVLPERRYSLNTLIAAGIAGFVLGRLFAR